MSDLSAEGWSGRIGNFSQNLAQFVIHGSTKVASQPLKWRPTATPTLVPKPKCDGKGELTDVCPRVSAAMESFPV